jgi:hypothetical protein
MNTFIQIIKVIPAIIGILKSIFSFVQSMREKKHDDAMSKLDKAKSKDEVREALNDLSKNG